MCSNKSDLIIFINGSGMNSVLGVKEGGKWKSVEFPYFITKTYKDTYDIAIPEKLNFTLGENCVRNIEKLKNYTVEGLVTAYTQTIDGYLDVKNYNNVILFGISEGGLLLPKIYNNLQNKTKIEKIIIWGAGGYSQYDCFRIVANSAVPMPEEYRAECSKIFQVSKAVEKDPYSMNKLYLGWPYNRWSSFFDYQPIKEYDLINIPILFVQGLYDYSSPVESVKYIQDIYSNKQYKYMFYKMGHVPDDDDEIKKILFDINSWIKG
jgi:esterase/lipase